MVARWLQQAVMVWVTVARRLPLVLRAPLVWSSESPERAVRLARLHRPQVEHAHT